jgi:glutamate N-acetyltransferase/amino-acid N-acetyltransferase
MTTDTLPKGASRKFTLGGETVTITGISKGAGMIKPNMATMLGYVATDANIDPSLLQGLLTQSVEQSFNRITIDGDTSTNDSCMLIATGKSAAEKITSIDSDSYRQFAEELDALYLELAQAIVRDAEGATKFVSVEIAEGATSAECLKAAYAIAESPLVKTALFASDPNWGRILAALGRAGLDNLNVDLVSLSVNGVELAVNGGLSPKYREEQGVAAMAEAEIEIKIQLGRGSACETVWTSDLSYDYVRINADYRS